MPKTMSQVIVLCIARFGEPIAFTCIFPFVNQMIEFLHVTNDPSRVGYYGGIVESLFFIVSFLTVFAWGKMSDWIGRKPCICVGLFGTGLSVILFGFSQSFTHMIIARCLGGMLCGNVAVIKSAIGEITTHSNQAIAFSYFPLAWGIGSVIGPSIGGFLAEPATKYPDTFGRYAFFHKFPYALPCIVAGTVPFIALVLVLLCLEETLVKDKHELDEETAADVTATADASTAADVTITADAAASEASATPTNVTLTRETPTNVTPDVTDASLTDGMGTDGAPARETTSLLPGRAPRPPLLTPQVKLVLINYMFLAFETVCLDALVTLFFYTPRHLGGLEFSEEAIGTVMSFNGVASIVCQLLLFPRLEERYGTAPFYQTLMMFYPVIFLLFPLMSLTARVLPQAFVLVLIAVFVVLRATSNMVYGLNMILVTRAAPSRQQLGSLNGVAQTLSSLMRGLGPVSASSLFAFSINKHLAGGFFAFYVMTVIALGGAYVTKNLDDTPAPWKPL